MTEQVTQKFKGGAYQHIKKQYQDGLFKKRYAIYCFSLLGIEEKEAVKIMAEWRKEERRKVCEITEKHIKERLEANLEN